MESTLTPPRLQNRPETPGANGKGPRCLMAVSPLQGYEIQSPPLPALKTWAPERLANPHRRKPTSCAPAASPELSRTPQPARACPWRSRFLPPASRAHKHCEFSSRFFFEGTFFCIASGRLPGDHRAIRLASRRRRPPPIQATAGWPPGPAGPSLSGS